MKYLLFALVLACGAAHGAERWSAEQANAWYARQRWPLGSDYIPYNAINQLEMWQADTFWPEKFEARVRQLRKYNRPIICTEYLARGAGSTIDNSLPAGKRLYVGMINCGFVLGKTQTNFPWDSWQRPYTLELPAVWHHDLLRPDGTPYRQREAEILRTLSSLPRGVVRSP